MDLQTPNNDNVLNAHLKSPEAVECHAKLATVDKMLKQNNFLLQQIKQNLEEKTEQRLLENETFIRQLNTNLIQIIHIYTTFSEV